MSEETEQSLQHQVNKQEFFPQEVNSPIAREMLPEPIGGSPAVIEGVSIENGHTNLTKKKIALLAIVFF